MKWGRNGKKQREGKRREHEREKRKMKGSSARLLRDFIVLWSVTVRGEARYGSAKIA